MPTSPVESEVPADVGQPAIPDTGSSPVDSAPVQPESPATPEPELSEADLNAQYLEVALKAAEAPKAPDQPDPKAGSDPKSLDPATPPENQDKAEEDDEEDDGADHGEPFGRHPRWQKMVAARNEYREKASTFSQEVEQLRPQAEQYGLIEQYMQSNGLNSAEVIDGFKIMALMKQDPSAAREALAVQLHRLDSFLGNVLPPELQAQVDEGFTTEEIAREVVRARNQQQRLQNENQAYRQHTEQQQTAQQEAQARQGMVSAVQQWEAQVRTRDPDYAMKESFVVDKLRVLRTQYQVRTPEQAVQLAQMAYAEATKQLRALNKRPELRPSGAGNLAVSSSTAKPQPRSLEEACLQAAGFGTS